MSYNLHVECNKCDNWEEQGADDPRHHLNEFTFTLDLDSYTCNECGSYATATYVEQEEDGSS